MSWFDSFTNTKVDKSYISDAQRVLDVCRACAARERSDLKVSVVLALKYLLLDSKMDTDPIKCIELFLDVMATGRRLTDKEVVLASAYTIKLGALQRQAFESTNQVNNLIASGIPVWIMSIRALSHPVILPQVQEIWSILQNGDYVWYVGQYEYLKQNLQGGHPLGASMEGSSYFDTPNIFKKR